MSALVQRGSAQGRPLALAITIGVHVALVSGLLAIKVVDGVKQYTTPIQLQDIREEPRPVPQVVPIEPVMGKPTSVPRPVVELRDAIFQNGSISAVVDPPREVLTIDPPEIPDSSRAVPDTPLRHEAVRSSDDYYPPQAIRLGIEGAVIVRACADAQGRLSGRPAVIGSSRQSLLDAAAVRWAGEALRFRPATQAGVAVAACKEFRVNFNLH